MMTGFLITGIETRCTVRLTPHMSTVTNVIFDLIDTLLVYTSDFWFIVSENIQYLR